MDLTSVFAQHKSRNIFFALLSFSYAFIIYTFTVAPTTSFWDPAEYIAVAHTLQVAHPPGSPFFTLVGRVVSMFIPSEYVALSINMISVTASAFAVMLLYLIIVRLIQEWRGSAEEMDTMDLIGMYSGGLIAACMFTVTHTQWFNAVEAEMYASSMFFTALVVWMTLRWSANHDKPYSERWLVLIAFMFGIGIGVHLLNLLAIFFIALIIYFKKYEFSLSSFLAMVGIAVAAFLSIYPVTIILIPDMAGRIGNITYGLIGPATFVVLLVLAVSFGIYYTQKKGMRIANIVMLCYMMIIIGYSSYALVLIRSQASPPIDQNDPSTTEAFVSYLSRDQYGQSPLFKGNTYNDRTGSIDRTTEVLFPRRHSAQPNHLEYYSRFSSDPDYFLTYQINHMYLRYLNWNFIGRDADIQDAGWYGGFGDTRHADNPANTPYFFLPFLLGLFGLIYHFRKDWPRATAVTALFILTGLAIVVYLNQTPFEPRERDYAYVGSFFAFSIWVGIGITAIIDYLKQFSGKNIPAAYATTLLLFLAVPFWMAVQNWPAHDRSNNYVPRDYAYNLLMSLEDNAIVFTNGDNDTFPLWYIQEVEGIRTDVRVVNLSLLNTDWYILQLRDQNTHEALPIAIDLTDEEIETMTSSLELHEPGDMVIPVKKELLRSVFEATPDQLEDSTSTLYRSLSTAGDLEMNEMMFNQLRMATPYSMPVDSLDNEVRFYVEGRFAGRDNQGNPRYYLQTQDKMILHLLENNMWIRPIYFANTVSRTGQVGLEDYFQFEGKSFRVVPKKRQAGPFGYVDPDIHAERMSQFEFNQWNNPDVYFDENVRRMLGNYRYGFTQLADAYMRDGNIEQAAYWLKFGEDKIPFRKIEHDWTVAVLYAYRYMKVDETERAVELADFISAELMSDLRWDMEDLNDLENQISSLEEELREARQSAKMQRAQTITSQISNLRNRVQEKISDLSFNVSRITILQNVYFELEETDLAELLGAEVDIVTDRRLALPDSIEESREQIIRFGIDL